jgi:hypothetical protein
MESQKVAYHFEHEFRGKSLSTDNIHIHFRPGNVSLVQSRVLITWIPTVEAESLPPRVGHQFDDFFERSDSGTTSMYSGMHAHYFDHNRILITIRYWFLLPHSNFSRYDAFPFIALTENVIGIQTKSG